MRKTAVQTVSVADVEFMRDLEVRYGVASGLPDRSRYAIVYGPVRRADVLALGINPGGNPEQVASDGTYSVDGQPKHAASVSYFENDESSVLDSDWPENRGLLKLLRPLFDQDDAAIRAKVVKTNMAFRRSRKVTQIELEAAKSESAPFLAEIIRRVQPRLVLLTGVKLEDFTGRFCGEVGANGEALRDPGVKQTVFRAARVMLGATAMPALVVQVAHASQFAWTYDKYEVVARIRACAKRVASEVGDWLPSGWST